MSRLTFPKFTGERCLMMPFIQGDSKSLPENLQQYSEIINNNFLEKGEIGFLTIDERFVNAGNSQRGYNSKGIERNVHIEVGHLENSDKLRWGGQNYGWGSRANVILTPETNVLIGNNLDDTCRYWDKLETRHTKNGDLSDYIDDYTEESGILMKAGELVKINILNPHECIKQTKDAFRQFIRIVGKGVTGREEKFTINPLLV